MMHFNGRIAVVTGGGNGIGKSIVQRLAQTGCKIAVIDKQKESLDSLRQFLSKYKNDILPFQGDVTDRESLKEISEEISFKLGEPSILINNAGVLIRNTIEEKEILKSWEKTIDVNLTG